MTFIQNNVILLEFDTPMMPKVIRSFPISEQRIKEITTHGDPYLFVRLQGKSGSFPSTGCLCNILNYDSKPEGSLITLEGTTIARVVSENLESQFSFHFANVEVLSDVKQSEVQINVSYKELLKKWKNIAGKVKMSYLPELNETILNDATNGPYLIVDLLNEFAEEKQALIELRDPLARIDYVKNILGGYDYDSKIENELNLRVHKSMEKSQIEYFLREKMKALKDMLKPYDGNIESDDKYEKFLLTKEYPENIRKTIQSELNRLRAMPSGSQEGTISRSYLDLVCSLPWFNETTDQTDLKEVTRILDEDHYGLEKQKDRIIEYLSVKQMTNSLRSPILCLFGPPGVGKTSLAISIARALNRKFVKASLGGISDESEIRGHRRTYLGAMPGKIISNIKKCGVRNPVFLLDEIDKLKSSAFHGDPASALLEVLDPEQNQFFQDNYLDEPYDLSHVLFICTANSLKDIPEPLRDRLELIELNSYTVVEKLKIAQKYLVKLERKDNGLSEDMISFEDNALTYLIEFYTREAGVRDLRRKIATIMRKHSVNYLRGEEDKNIIVNKELVEKYLGKPIFEHTKSNRADTVGIVTGLAYTEYGGEVLPIEVNFFKGNGKIIKTGNLGDIMKESAEIAVGYIRANATKYFIADDFFDKHDIFIHVPEGATPKDGPSAGVALTLAILSAITGKKIKSTVAMTGEVDLRGNAMAIGGLREKTLAACREGIELVLAPKENHKDIDELPAEVKNTLRIQMIESVDDAIQFAYVEPFEKHD